VSTGISSLNQQTKMNLDENQKQKVAQWIDEGVKLSEIQSLLTTEFGIKMTYMEVRFLVDDLNLTPKDPEPAQTEEPPKPDPKPIPLDDSISTSGGDTPAPSANKGVSVSVDKLTKPGSLVSGSVTFSDGNVADWYLDQTGRLGLAPKTEGYRPSATDVQEFQAALEREISRAGL
jgi:hypothetical protein